MATTNTNDKLINYGALKQVAEALKAKIDTKADQTTVDGIKIENNVITVGGTSLDVGNLINTTGGKIDKIQVNGTDLTISDGKVVNITYDNSLSDTSENAVQNKVLKEELDKTVTNVEFKNNTLYITVAGDETSVLSATDLSTSLNLKGGSHLDVSGGLDEETSETKLATNAETKALNSSKADKATTLAGYGIDNAYTKENIDTKLKTITDKLEALNSFEYIVRNTEAKENDPEGTTYDSKITLLPTASDKTMYKIYLVADYKPTETISTENDHENYNEYITVKKPDNTYVWEKLGDTTIDLSNYVKTGTSINGHALTDNVTITASDINATNSDNLVVTVQNELNLLETEIKANKDKIGLSYIEEVKDGDTVVTAERQATGLYKKIRDVKLGLDTLKTNTTGEGYTGINLNDRLTNAENTVAAMKATIGEPTKTEGEIVTNATGLRADIEALQAVDVTHDNRLTALESSLNDSTTGLIKKVSTNEMNISSNTSAICTNSNDIHEINTLLNGKAASEGGESVIGLTQKVATNISDISSLGDRMTIAESAIDTLEDTLDNSTNGIKVRVTSLENSLSTGSALDNRIVSIETTLNGKDSETGLVTKVSTLQTEVEDSTNGLLARTNTLESDLNTTTTGVKARITSLESAIDNETDGVKKRISDLETTVNDSSTGLINRMNTAEDKVSTLESTLGNTTTGMVLQVSTNASNISTLQTTVGDANAGLVHDNSVNQSNISALQTAVGGSASGLTKDVADIKNEIGAEKTDTESATGIYAKIQENTDAIATHNTVTTAMQSAIDNINTTGLPSKADKSGDSTVDFSVKTLTATSVTVGGKTVATEEYVTQNGGKIDSISVNGTNNKVTIDASKNVDLTIPTKVSDLTNDKGYVRTTGSTLIDPVVTRNWFNSMEELNRLLPYGSTSIVFVIDDSAIAYYKDGAWVEKPLVYGSGTGSADVPTEQEKQAIISEVYGNE